MWVQQARPDKQVAFQNQGDINSGGKEDLQPLITLQGLGGDLGLRWQTARGFCYLEDGKPSGKMTGSDLGFNMVTWDQDNIGNIQTKDDGGLDQYGSNGGREERWDPGYFEINLYSSFKNLLKRCHSHSQQLFQMLNIKK